MAADKKAAPQQPWHAEAILDILRDRGYGGLSFGESHFGNCATIVATKPV